MPLYEYECSRCAERIEVIQKFSDDPLTACGKCGGPLRKLISSPAIQFKGSGWYITDYARKGSSAPSPATGAGGGGEAAKPDAKGSSPEKAPTPKENG